MAVFGGMVFKEEVKIKKIAGMSPDPVRRETTTQTRTEGRLGEETEDPTSTVTSDTQPSGHRGRMSVWEPPGLWYLLRPPSPTGADVIRVLVRC